IDEGARERRGALGRDAAPPSRLRGDIGGRLQGPRRLCHASPGRLRARPLDQTAGPRKAPAHAGRQRLALARRRLETARAEACHACRTLQVLVDAAEQRIAGIHRAGVAVVAPDLVAPDAAALLARLVLRAGVAVITGRAVRRGTVLRAAVRSAVAGLGRVTGSGRRAADTAPLPIGRAGGAQPRAGFRDVAVPGPGAALERRRREGIGRASAGPSVEEI